MTGRMILVTAAISLIAEAKRLAQQLRVKGTGATERLKALKRTTGESWDEIKPAIEKAWAELRPALRSAAAKFRETQSQSPRAVTDDLTRGQHQGPPGVAPKSRT